MKKAFVLRHVAFEDLGSFESVLAHHEYEIHSFEAGMDNFAEIDPLEPDLLIVLGGPIGVYQAADYPFLKDEINLLEKRLHQDLPTLGICLGSQLMASALGARVYPGHSNEIGWLPLMLTEEGKQSCLVEMAPENTPVLHWHGDTFDLPKDAVRLASTQLFENQAFAWGKNCLALQFHVEVTQYGLERWFIGHTSEISATPDISVSQLRSDTKQYVSNYETSGIACLTRWLADTELGYQRKAGQLDEVR